MRDANFFQNLFPTNRKYWDIKPQDSAREIEPYRENSDLELKETIYSDELYPWSQGRYHFHQYLTSSFCVLFRFVIFCQIVNGAKSARKMLMKLALGLRGRWKKVVPGFRQRQFD